MGYLNYKKNHIARIKQFRPVEIKGSLMIGIEMALNRNSVLLVNNDLDTVHFARNNMPAIVKNFVMVLKMEKLTETYVSGSNSLSEESGSFFESISMGSGNNRLDLLKQSLKKAIISISLDRFNSDKEQICTVLGLSSSQLDDEMRLSGFALLEKKER